MKCHLCNHEYMQHLKVVNFRADINDTHSPQKSNLVNLGNYVYVSRLTYKKCYLHNPRSLFTYIRHLKVINFQANNDHMI